jgi:hypothetical protein
VPPYAPTDPSVAAFVAIPLGLLFLFMWAVARVSRPAGIAIAAAAAAVWMAGTLAVAVSGVLRDWAATPPPFALLVLAIVVISVGVAFSSLGRRIASEIPLWALVASQGFRLPLEIAMHRLAELGIMPPQMTYTGRNFDIVTGASALIVAILVATGRAGRRTVMAWNIVGLALLLNIVVIAVLSTPVFQFFGPDRVNVFVTYPPFVWLPAVMVLAALMGHLLVFRALRHCQN